MTQQIMCDLKLLIKLAVVRIKIHENHITNTLRMKIQGFMRTSLTGLKLLNQPEWIFLCCRSDGAVALIQNFFQACHCHAITAAGPSPQLIEEMKMWYTHILHTLASCHLTFTSLIFTQRGTLGQCRMEESNVRKHKPPLLPHPPFYSNSKSSCHPLLNN